MYGLQYYSTTRDGCVGQLGRTGWGGQVVRSGHCELYLRFVSRLCAEIQLCLTLLKCHNSGEFSCSFLTRNEQNKYGILLPTYARTTQPVTSWDQLIKSVIQLFFTLGSRVLYLGQMAYLVHTTLHSQTQIYVTFISSFLSKPILTTQCLCFISDFILSYMPWSVRVQ